MPAGVTLAALRKRLNAEIGAEMDETVSPANVTIHNQLLNNMQAFMVTQHAYLLGKTVVELPLAGGTRYYDPPATIDLDRLDSPVFLKVGYIRFELGYGIDPKDMNYWDSDRQLASPQVLRWDRKIVGGAPKLEVWPIPSPNAQQTLIFSGSLLLTQMVNDADTCVIDDACIYLFVAAEILARQGANDAEAKLRKAQAAFNSVRASFPMRNEVFNLGGADKSNSNLGFGGNGRRPVVATNAG